jgi:hypothetical protein
VVKKKFSLPADITSQLNLFMRTIEKYKIIKAKGDEIEARVKKVETDSEGLEAGERVLSLGEESIMSAVSSMKRKCKLSLAILSFAPLQHFRLFHILMEIDVAVMLFCWMLLCCSAVNDAAVMLLLLSPMLRFLFCCGFCYVAIMF